MSKQSAGRTIITHVAPDRVIGKFPQAFHADGTPYKKLNFHARVKGACSEQRTGTVGLKICKGVVVGDVSVGKTSLVNRFCHNVFDRDYKATIGVDFEVEKFSVLGVPFTLQLWDTAGQERFKCIAASYYRGTNVVIVVFDLSDLTSLQHSTQWMVDATENASDPTKFLVGTKRDLLSEEAYIDIESKALRIANDVGAEYWALSSKTGENVREFFFRVVSLTFDEAVLRELDLKTSPTVRSVGNTLVSLKNEEDVYERKSPNIKCCV